jgi:hypothetical protein
MQAFEIGPGGELVFSRGDGSPPTIVRLEHKRGPRARLVVDAPDEVRVEKKFKRPEPTGSE